jgi:hypothetical protein
VRSKVLKDQLSSRDRSGFAAKTEKLARRPADKRTKRLQAGKLKKNYRKRTKIDPINKPRKENAHRRRSK